MGISNRFLNSDEIKFVFNESYLQPDYILGNSLVFFSDIFCSNFIEKLFSLECSSKYSLLCLLGNSIYMTWKVFGCFRDNYRLPDSIFNTLFLHGTPFCLSTKMEERTQTASNINGIPESFISLLN